MSYQALRGLIKRHHHLIPIETPDDKAPREVPPAPDNEPHWAKKNFPTETQRASIANLASFRAGKAAARGGVVRLSTGVPRLGLTGVDLRSAVPIGPKTELSGVYNNGFGSQSVSVERGNALAGQQRFSLFSGFSNSDFAAGGANFEAGYGSARSSLDMSHSLEQGVKYLGKSTDEAGAPRTPETPRIEITRSQANSVSLQGSLLVGAGRLDYARDRETKYRINVSEKCGRQLLSGPRSGAGEAVLNRFFRRNPHHRLEALPKLEDLSTFSEGSEMVVRLTGTYYGSVVAGGFGAHFGKQRILRGEVELQVLKVSASCVRVMFTPIYTDGARSLAAQSLGAQTFTEAADLSLLQVCYELDTSQACALAAYQKLIRGDLPAALQPPEKTHLAMPLETQLAHQVKRANTCLPAGVQVTCVTRLTATHHRSHTGLRWFCIPNSLAPSGMVTAYAKERILTTNQKTVTWEKSALTTTLLSGNSEARWRLQKGRNTQGVFSWQCWKKPADTAHINNDAEFESLILQLRFASTRINRLEVYQKFILPLARAVAACIRSLYIVEGTCQYIDLQRRVEAHDLTFLADIDLHVSEHQILAKDITQGPHLTYDELNSFILQLHQIKGTPKQVITERAQCVQAFIQSADLQRSIYRVGALHRLLGSDIDKLTIETKNNLFQDLRLKAEQLQLKWPREIDGATPLREIRQRLRETHQLLKQVVRVRKMNNAGKGLDRQAIEQSEALLDEIETIGRAVIRVRPSRRSAVRLVLGSCTWHTAVERQYINYLTPHREDLQSARNLARKWNQQIKEGTFSFAQFSARYFLVRRRVQAFGANLIQDTVLSDKTRSAAARDTLDTLLHLDKIVTHIENKSVYRERWQSLTGFWWWLNLEAWRLRSYIVPARVT